jgi:hypothetical protein
MNHLEVVKYVLDLVVAQEVDRANEILHQKHQQLQLQQVQGIRQEITEIVKMMNQIDMELMQFRLKKSQLERLCPDVTMNSLNSYIDGLQKQRKKLALEKSKMAKQYSKA